MMRPAAGGCGESGQAIAVAAAHALLAARTAPMVGHHVVPLDRALACYLARPLLSPRDVPAFDNAAVDGYAFAFAAGMEAGARLELAPGRAAAGRPFTDEVAAGTALRVLTGAMMPPGTDSVALQEQVVLHGRTVELPAGLRQGANRRLAGEDVRAGEPVLRAGTCLRPQDIGLAAALGQAALTVFEPLRLALFSTGDELAEPGSAPGPGTVFDANRHVLQALLRALPVEVTDLGIVRDDVASVAAALRRAASDHHVVLTSGGASRGDEDHVVRSVAAMGRLDFWQVAVKPGRPLAFGRIGDAVFIGLPGNPVAALVAFLLFARPVLRRLGGAPWQRPTGLALPAAFGLRKKAGRTEFPRAVVVHDPERGPSLARVPRQGSGMLGALRDADGLVELGHAVELVEPGDRLPFFSFADLGIPA